MGRSHTKLGRMLNETVVNDLRKFKLVAGSLTGGLWW